MASILCHSYASELTKTVEEGSSVMLPCLSVDENDDYDERSWYDGWFDEPQGEDSTLFKQEGTGNIVIDNGLPDMSVNKDKFSLVISSAKLGNHTVYTCYVYTDALMKYKETWDYIKLHIYSKY